MKCEKKEKNLRPQVIRGSLSDVRMYPDVRRRILTSADVSIRQRTSGYVSRSRASRSEHTSA
jgi:hypothetical protein